MAGDIVILGWETGWLPLSLLAVLISLLVHGLIYAFATAFNFREMQVSTKAEMLQTSATALIAIFLILIISSLSEYVNTQMYGEVACGGEIITTDDVDAALQVAQCRVIEKAVAIEEIHNNARKGMDSVMRQFGASFYIMGLPVWSGQYSSNLYKEIETARFKNNITTVFLISLNALITFIAYLKDNMLTYFLPLGIVLRAFHFTRGIGALFISIAIGFYFVFPYVFILSDPGFVKLPMPPDPQPSPLPNFCYPTMSAAVSMINYQQISAGNLGQDAAFSGSLGRLYASLLVHPLVSLFMTIVFIRYLMYLFGEEAYDVLRTVTKVI